MSDIYSLIKTVLVLISVWMALLFITPGVARASDLNEKMIDAAYEGDLKAVETALTNGADVNSGEGPHGRTALMCAAWMGRGKIAALLINKNADVNLADSTKNTALHYASDFGSLDIVRLLLKHGANVNALDEDGMTALIDAAHSGHTDVVKELIRHGADPTLKNNENKTAADIARENGHDGLIKILENALKK